MLITEKQIEAINRDLQFHSTMKGRRVESIQLLDQVHNRILLTYYYYVPRVVQLGITEDKFERQVRIESNGQCTVVNEYQI